MADLDWSKFHKFTKKADPLGHYAVDHTWKASTRSVNKTSDGLATVAEKWGINSTFPRFWEGQSEKDIQSIDRYLENTGTAAGIIYAGMSAYGAYGGGSGGTTGGTTYLEQGGGQVADKAGGGFSWNAINGDGVAGQTGALGQGGGWSWADGMRQGGSAMQNSGGQQRDEPLEESKVEFEDADLRADPYAYSSKKVKAGPRASMRAVMERGAAGADPIDQNGVHMAAIQALTAKVENAKARLSKLKGKHA